MSRRCRRAQLVCVCRQTRRVKPVPRCGETPFPSRHFHSFRSSSFHLSPSRVESSLDVCSRRRTHNSAGRSGGGAGPCLQSTAYFFDPPRAFSRCYRKTYRSQLTQPCIPPGSLNRVPASAGHGQGGNVSSAGWQVTLCDPMWHASSRSGVAALRTAIHLLLT